MTARRWIPAATVAFFVLLIAAGMRPERRPGGYDLAGFGAIPVLNNGRLKPLDTVARTSLLVLRGKQTVRVSGGTMQAVEWLAEAMSNAPAADERPVFVINDPDVLGLMGKQQTGQKYFSFKELAPNLNEIEAQGRHAEEVESPQRSRFQSAVLSLYQRLLLYQGLRTSLVPPGADDLSSDIAAFRETLVPGMKAMADHQSEAKFDRDALQRFFTFVERYRFMAGTSSVLPLAPPAGEEPNQWTSVGEGLMGAFRNEGRFHPGVDFYSAITGSFRQGNAEAFNRAVWDYRRWLAERAPRATARSRYETWFNRSQPFYRGMTIYLVAFLLVVVSWLKSRDVLQRSAYWLLWLAFVVHTVGLVSRMVLQGRPPVTNLYSSAIFVGWAAVLLGLLLERFHRKGFGTAVSAAVGFVTLIIAHHLGAQGDTLEMMRAVLDSNFWLATHVVAITIGYSSMFLAGALAHAWIFRRWPKPMPRNETDEALAQMTYGVICFALLFSFVGTVLGGIWADQSWGRFWGWDPKENGALLIVLWNAIVLHARWGNYAGDRGLMAMAVFGGIITSLSWFGVNMLGIGLHSYGFMDKAFFWLAAFILLECAVIVIGLRSAPPTPNRRSA